MSKLTKDERLLKLKSLEEELKTQNEETDTPERKACKCSNENLDKNINNWEKMQTKFKPGEAIVRFRGDIPDKDCSLLWHLFWVNQEKKKRDWF